MEAVSLTGTCVDINLDSSLGILCWHRLNIIGNKPPPKKKGVDCVVGEWNLMWIIIVILIMMCFR